MLKKHLIFFLIILIFDLSFFSVKALKNQIIVKIDNDIITAYELKNKLKTSLILSNQKINQENIDNNKRRALAYLIDLKLKKIELKKYKVEMDKLNVNNQLLALSSNNISEFKKKFQALGINFDLFVKELKVETAWKQLMYQIYKDKVKVNQQEIDKQVLGFIKNNSQITEFKISEIEISLDENTNYLNEVNFITKEIQENGFENTAFKFSNSSSAKNYGDIGWINSESLSSRVSKILKDLKKGEISNPIKNPNSLLFLKLTDRKTSKVNDINAEEFKKKLIEQKKNELFTLYSRSHLSKLKNNSLIEYK